MNTFDDSSEFEFSTNTYLAYCTNSNIAPVINPTSTGQPRIDLDDETTKNNMVVIKKYV